MIDSSLMFHIFEIINYGRNMEYAKNYKKYLILLQLIILGFIAPIATSQPVVGLDNWYNHEINAKTGIPFHYLWTDTAFSGYSRWGKIFSERGAKLTTLGKPDANILDKVSIYIIVDPDTTTESKSPNYIMPDEILIIEKWVRNGGVLALLGNDAPNCEFTHFNQLASKFGIKFNHVTLHPVAGTNFEMGASKNLPDHPLFKGVTKIYLKEVSDMNLSGTAKGVLTENGKVLIAENRYGKGYVFAIGDPWIYNEYIDHDRLPESFENRKAAENLTDLLLSFTQKR
jgi:unsaturated rhamnogalacturonyl hydrolase